MNRAAMLASVLALGVYGCTSEPDDSAAPGDYIEADIATLQAEMDAGTLTSRALVDYFLQRIESVDRNGPELRSIIEINPDARAIADALDSERRDQGPRGPLHGIPVVLKGNIDTGDQMATSAGSLALADHRAPDDAFIVRQLRDAGAVILAKANLSEWANFRSTRSSSGWSSLGGQTRNPYDLSRNPCGSSSGSGASVAANLTVLAVGTETDGSVVCPAGVNGIVGIKPTIGLVSRDGIIPIAHSQDTAGPMARSVRDAALMLNAMSAADSGDPAAAVRPASVPDYAADLDADALRGKRIGVVRSYGGAGENPYVDEKFDAAVAVLQQHGATIVDSIELDTQDMGDAELEVLYYEFKADLNAYLQESSAPVATMRDIIAFNTANADTAMPFFGQEHMERAVEKGPLTDADYLDALETSKRIARNAVDGALNEHRLDALVAPTNGPAWKTDHVNGDHFSVGSSSLAAVSGYASVTVPAGYVFDLPVGISFIGGAFSEQQLIQIAFAFEQATKARRAPEFP
jgi:amidase